MAEPDFKGYLMGAYSAEDPDTFETWTNSITVDFGGIIDDRHYGIHKKAGVRESHYVKGSTIRNNRQLSIVSLEELAAIADRLGIEEVKPEWLGANLALYDVPLVSHLPPGTRIDIFPVSLIVHDTNDPCIHPGKVIEEHTGVSASKFPKAAHDLRGVTAYVDRPGNLGRVSRHALVGRARKDVEVYLPRNFSYDPTGEQFVYTFPGKK